MSNYSIKNYTFYKAKMYGLIVKPSTRKGKKLDNQNNR